jgi:hypothetical protein
VTYTRCDIDTIKPLNAELDPICHLLAFLGAHHILHVSRIRVNSPDGGHMAARNMQRIKINIHEKELCVKLVIYKNSGSIYPTISTRFMTHTPPHLESFIK